MTSCRIHRTTVLAIVLGCLLQVDALGAQTLRIGTLDASRNGPAAVADGVLTSDARASLTANIQALGFDDHEFVAVPQLTEDALSGVDVVILHNGWDLQSPMMPELSLGEQEALFDFVDAGGGALLIPGGLESYVPAANALAAPFEVVVDGHIVDVQENAVADPRAHPVTDGPFGEVRYIRTCYPGWFSDLGPYASSLCDSSENGQPILAAIEAGAIGPKSGRVVLLSDGSPFGDASLAPDCLFFSEHEALFLNAMAWLSEGTLGPSHFRRGDCNDDGTVDISDPIFSLAAQFIGDGDPLCDDACDSNDDGVVDISDPIGILGVLFLGDGVIPAPGTLACGVDPTEDRIGCESTVRCP